MIRFYKIVVAAAPTVYWKIGQFADEKKALWEYNSEVRQAKRDGITTELPELQFADRTEEVEYFLTEEEVTHTQIERDEAIETGRWGLVRKVST
jgi:hypothetical protein